MARVFGHVTHMKQTLALGAALALLASCTPLKIYHKPGVSVTRAQTDTTQCEVSALKQAPVNIEIRRDPPEFVPARRVCDDAGKCREYGGYWIPGEVYTVDLNKGLRKRVELQCMAARGYSPAKIEQCPPGVQATGVTTVLPPISDKSCVIKNKDGTFLIVDQA